MARLHSAAAATVVLRSSVLLSVAFSFLQSLLRSMTLGAAALAAQAAGSSVPRECCFFASIAPDGKVRVLFCIHSAVFYPCPAYCCARVACVCSRA
jgi:hypothetical protein